MFNLNRETVQCRCITVPHIFCLQLIIFCQIIMILINEANDTYSYICTGVFECPRHTGVPSKCVWNTRVSTRKARESDTTKPKGVLTGFWRWSKICNTKACEIHNIFWFTLLYMTALPTLACHFFQPDSTSWFLLDLLNNGTDLFSYTSSVHYQSRQH